MRRTIALATGLLSSTLWRGAHHFTENEIVFKEVTYYSSHPGLEKEVQHALIVEPPENFQVLDSSQNVLPRREVQKYILFTHGLQTSARSPENLKMARELARRGLSVMLWDRPGSGANRNPENQIEAGDLLSVEHALTAHGDAYAFLLEKVRQKYPTDAEEHIGLAATSFGAKIAIPWMARNPEKIRGGAFLFMPALKVRNELKASPLLIASILIRRFSEKMIPFFRIGPKRFSSPIQIQHLVGPDNIAVLDKDDPNLQRKFTARFFLVTSKLDKLIKESLPQLVGNFFVVLANKDRVVDNTALFKSLGNMAPDARRRIQIETLRGDCEHILTGREDIESLGNTAERFFLSSASN